MSEGGVKEMAELLRKGARMMSEACPECGTPLFKLKNGEIICPSCNRPVKVVKGDTTEETVTQQGSLEATLRKKISEVQAALDREQDAAAIREITSTLMALLDALDKVRKLGA
jgi:UPF0148 protein